MACCGFSQDWAVGIGRRDGATAAMLLRGIVRRCRGYGGAGQELHWHARRCYWGDEMRYEFLVETYATERVKVVSVWSEFQDGDMEFRPNAGDARGRSVREQMVHQCVSEDLWFRNMLGIDVGAPPLPGSETRIEFMRRYAEDSGKRLAALRSKEEGWWEGETKFFDVTRSRAWVMTRRIAHTSHHRGQQMAMLRMLGRDLHSNYGPTADTGGLMQNHAPTIYAYGSLQELLAGESEGGRKARLPGAGGKAVTERAGT